MEKCTLTEKTKETAADECNALDKHHDWKEHEHNSQTILNKATIYVMETTYQPQTTHMHHHGIYGIMYNTLSRRTKGFVASA